MDKQGYWHILSPTNGYLDKPTATGLAILVPHNADFTKVPSYHVLEAPAYANSTPSFAFEIELRNW